MSRLKKLQNNYEATTERLLSPAAARNGARVCPKVRVADVFEIRQSGISDDLFGYAFRAHFDLLVTDDQDFPLFVVEYDGDTHDRDPTARENDLRKNALCEHFELPLARVREEHLFQAARGMNYVTWLAELFFGGRAIDHAYEDGTLPPDDYFDPLSFISVPGLDGRFPLWLSGAARVQLLRHAEAGRIGALVPFNLQGWDHRGAGYSIVIVPVPPNRFVFAMATIYLARFGYVATDAAEEIAVVALEGAVREYLATGKGSFDSSVVRELLVRTLRGTKTIFSAASGAGVDLGFKIHYRAGPDREEVVVGALGDAPEVVAYRRA